jgi:ubiquinone/menaquinone biosynthesis C-methylase UbiE
MSTSAPYWNERAERLGHTGWNNPVVYAFDQMARLKTIETVLDALDLRGGTALDFGTGTGDFLPMLAGRFHQVIAYDISGEVLRLAKKRHGGLANVQFSIADCFSNLPLQDHSLALILCVTVLQHVMDDGELLEILQCFRRKLCTTGTVLHLGCAPHVSRPTAPYQRFLSLEGWRALFGREGFYLHKQFGFHHPVERPSRTYQAYRRDPWVRALAPVSGLKFAQRLLGRRAHRHLARNPDCYWPASSGDVVRIMIWKCAEENHAKDT